MGFFKSLFSDSGLAEGTIKAVEKYYWKARKHRPGEDEHFYLASTLKKRIETQMMVGQNPFGAPRGEELDLFTLIQTRYFSVLDPPESIRAFALFIVSKEVPKEAYRYEQEFNELIKPIMKMEEEHTFNQTYRKKNPSMVRQD